MLNDSKYDSNVRSKTVDINLNKRAKSYFKNIFSPELMLN